nr:hypothetical protein L204_01512 [Cryptococcus depauperatus CBS 7855]
MRFEDKNVSWSDGKKWRCHITGPAPNPKYPKMPKKFGPIPTTRTHCRPNGTKCKGNFGHPAPMPFQGLRVITIARDPDIIFSRNPFPKLPFSGPLFSGCRDILEEQLLTPKSPPLGGCVRPGRRLWLYA